MEQTERNVDDFIASLPDERRDQVKELDRIIYSVMEGQPRVLYEGTFWGGSHQEIIGYGTMRYRRSDKQEVEWFTVGLAAQKNYLSIYVNVVEDRQYLSEKYAADLGKVKVGKSSISFKSIDDIDRAKLTSLLERARAVTGGG